MHRASLLAVVFATAASAIAGPPPSPIEPATDTLHNTPITDRYRWLEGDNTDPALPGQMTDRVANWTDAQNAYTRSILDALPGRAELEARLRPLLEIGYVAAPTIRNERLFYMKREGDQAQPVLMFRQRHDAEPRVLFNPTQHDPSGLTALSWNRPDDSGTLLAFGLQHAGNENDTLYIKHVDTGETLPDTITGRVDFLGWLPDSSGFFYKALADINNPYSGQVRFHRLGSPVETDPVLFSPEPDSTDWGYWAYPSHDGRWLSVIYSYGGARHDLWVMNLDHYFRTGEINLTELAVGHDASSWSLIDRDTLYLVTTIDAPNSKVYRVDLDNPSQDNWQLIIPERSDASLESLSLAGNQLIATYLKDAYSHIERFTLDGSPLGTFELPGIGTASLNTSRDSNTAYLSFASFNEPRSIYRVDLTTGDRTLWDRVQLAVDPFSVVVKQVHYPSRDGTRISMFVIHNDNITLDGSNPTQLYGYGGFNNSKTPFFSQTLITWLNDGGVFALPNLRGGGEYGESWHRAGMQENKQNVFDDFIAAAQWLIDNDYTSPDKLAISGGSNGGLLTGACLIQRPDLFAAVISDVPLLDMIRYQHFLMGSYWIGEYGSSDSPDQLAYLLKYSPYHNVHDGTAYPATLLLAAENDARVHPLHARKMAARLQAATSADPAEDPILLLVDRDSGHGSGKPTEKILQELVDKRLFIMWQLGMLDYQPAQSN